MLIAAIVVAIELTKTKEGAAGGSILVFARAGVSIAVIGFLMLNFAAPMMESDAVQWLILGLRVLILLCYLLTLVAFLLMRPESSSPEGVSHG